MINQNNIYRLIWIILLGIVALGAGCQPFSRPYVGSDDRCISQEAKSFLRTINRAQQGYLLEEGRFASTIENLRLRFPPMKYYYSSPISLTPYGTVQYVVPKSPSGISCGIEVNMYSYVASVVQLKKDEEKYFYSIVCESDTPTTSRVAAPVVENGKLYCGANSHDITH